jgi:phage recombination protein Bet
MNLYGFSEGDIETLRTLRYPNTKDVPDHHLETLLHEASRRKLDPLSGQIHLIVRSGRPTIQTGIDGLRLLAERTQEYAGQTPPLWCGNDGVWHDVWVGEGPPYAAKVGVYRKGFTEALIAVAKWQAYGSGQMMWGKMPDHMLAKVAEALALRKAFPEEMSGLYSDEEMDQADKTGRNMADPLQNPKPFLDKHMEPKAEPAKALVEHAEAMAKDTGGEIVSPLNDDITYTKLLELLISGGKNGKEIDPPWPIPFAKNRLDAWKKMPKELHDKRVIWDQAQLVSKFVKDRIVTDLDELLKERNLSRDEAKVLLGVDSMPDLLNNEGFKVPSRKELAERLDEKRAVQGTLERDAGAV